MPCLKTSRDALKAQDDMLHSLPSSVLFQETKDSTWRTCGNPAIEWTKMRHYIAARRGPSSRDLTVGHFTRVSILASDWSIQMAWNRELAWSGRPFSFSGYS
jgi:hypothetical protein